MGYSVLQLDKLMLMLSMYTLDRIYETEIKYSAIPISQDHALSHDGTYVLYKAHQNLNVSRIVLQLSSPSQ